MEIIEVRAKTVELAKQAALEELGIEDHDRVEWEILQEPARGFLGMGRQDAIVRAKRKPPKRRRSRGGRGGRGAKTRAAKATAGAPKKKNPRAPQERGPSRQRKNPNRSKEQKGKARSSIQEQAQVADDFLAGLLKAIAVNGEVKARHQKDLIVAEIEGEDTEMLVGQRGSGIEALHTIAKSVIKRKTSGGARLRLDVAGYGRRRREALAIYAAGLVEQVTAEGGELMLEAMNAADRKVIHDTVSKHENVRSYSEGEAPQRYVVIAYTGS